MRVCANRSLLEFVRGGIYSALLNFRACTRRLSRSFNIHARSIQVSKGKSSNGLYFVSRRSSARQPLVYPRDARNPCDSLALARRQPCTSCFLDNAFRDSVIRLAIRISPFLDGASSLFHLSDSHDGDFSFPDQSFATMSVARWRGNKCTPAVKFLAVFISRTSIPAHKDSHTYT